MVVELKGLFSLRQAAAALGIHEKTIFPWLKKGKITAVIIAGRRLIPESEIERLKKEMSSNYPQGDSGGGQTN